MPVTICESVFTPSDSFYYFQKIFAETKAQTTAIDLELRRIEAKEAALHVHYLSSFMPGGFMKRGGNCLRSRIGTMLSSRIHNIVYDHT